MPGLVRPNGRDVFRRGEPTCPKEEAPKEDDSASVDPFFWREKRAPKREGDDGMGGEVVVWSALGLEEVEARRERRVAARTALLLFPSTSSPADRESRRIFSCGVRSSWREFGRKSSSKAKLPSQSSTAPSLEFGESGTVGRGREAERILGFGRTREEYSGRCCRLRKSLPGDDSCGGEEAVSEISVGSGLMGP